MTRIECDAVTGQIRVITLTPEEESAALARQVAWELENTVDKRAVVAIDGLDRLWFEVNFDQENRVRVLESKAQITRVQYRDALIARWKVLNS